MNWVKNLKFIIMKFQNLLTDLDIDKVFITGSKTFLPDKSLRKLETKYYSYNQD